MPLSVHQVDATGQHAQLCRFIIESSHLQSDQQPDRCRDAQLHVPGDCPQALELDRAEPHVDLPLALHE